MFRTRMTTTMTAATAALVLAAMTPIAPAGIKEVNVKKFEISHNNGWGEGFTRTTPAESPRWPKELDLVNGVQFNWFQNLPQVLTNNQNPKQWSVAQAAMSYDFAEGTFNHIVATTAFSLGQFADLDGNGKASPNAASLRYSVELEHKFANALAFPVVIPVAGWAMGFHLSLPGEKDKAEIKLDLTWDAGEGTEVGVQFSRNWTGGGVQQVQDTIEQKLFLIPAGAKGFTLKGFFEAKLHHLGGEKELGGGNDGVSFMVTGPQVPSPGALALLGLAGITGLSRRRRR